MCRRDLLDMSLRSCHLKSSWYSGKSGVLSEMLKAAGDKFQEILLEL